MRWRVLVVILLVTLTLTALASLGRAVVTNRALADVREVATTPFPQPRSLDGPLLSLALEGPTTAPLGSPVQFRGTLVTKTDLSLTLLAVFGEGPEASGQVHRLELEKLGRGTSYTLTSPPLIFQKEGAYRSRLAVTQLRQRGLFPPIRRPLALVDLETVVVSP